jgi:hypothetical protein
MEPKIYFLSHFDIPGSPGAGSIMMVNLKKLLTENPLFLEYLRANPEALEFRPHLLFPPEKNREIQAYLQEIRNHFQCSEGTI